MDKNIVVGIDLAKTSFQIHVATRSGKVLGRHKLKRKEVLNFLAQEVPATTVFMEACPSANYWARRIEKLGLEVKLIAPQYVKPFVKGNKNDATDAEAICEAGCRENMRFVPVKTVAQQDLQSILRIRSRHVENRTALYNQVRSFLLENGIAAPKGMAKLRQVLTSALAEDCSEENDLSGVMRREAAGLQEEMRLLDEKIKEYDHKIKLASKADDRCMRIMTIPGVGPITATAMVAAVGNAGSFTSSRQMSAWLGLVPRQHSTGGKTRLLGLSKRGTVELRTLLIHGARAVLINPGEKKDARSRWATGLKEKIGMNKASVAFANKNARTIWALLTRGGEFEAKYKGRRGSPPAIKSPAVAHPA
jgi:transposase